MIDNSILYKSPAGYAALSAAYDEGLRRWPVPYESRLVETRHGQTHVLVAGQEDAPPLFFFHGWNGSAVGTFLELDLPRVAQHFRLYAPDTIGQSGRSAPNRPSVKGDAYGEWIRDLFDGLKVEHSAVSGISGGGYLSLKIAAYAPDRVTKAFVMSSAGLISLTRPGLGFLLATIPAFMFPGLATGRLFVRAVSVPKAPFTAAHEQMAQGMALMFRHYRMLGAPGTLTEAELRRITAPVYVLMGAHDLAVSPYKTVERARRLITNVQTEILPDAGHVLTFDRPDVAMERLLTFLA